MELLIQLACAGLVGHAAYYLGRGVEQKLWIEYENQNRYLWLQGISLVCGFLALILRYLGV